MPVVEEKFLRGKRQFQEFLVFLEYFAKELITKPTETEALKYAVCNFTSKYSADANNLPTEESGPIEIFPPTFREFFSSAQPKSIGDIFSHYFIDTVSFMLGVGLIWTGERILEFLPRFRSKSIAPLLDKYWSTDGPDLARDPVPLKAFEGSLVRYYNTIERVWALVYLMQHADLGGLVVDQILDRPSFLDTCISGIIHKYVKKHAPAIYVVQLARVTDVLPYEVPISYWCPNCHHYMNLGDDEWCYINRQDSSSPLKDYHVCSGCGNVWTIYKEHKDKW